jgi:hypothetical protein
MLFLQNVAKHADKLKGSGEPKVCCMIVLIFSYVSVSCMNKEQPLMRVNI